MEIHISAPRTLKGGDPDEEKKQYGQKLIITLCLALGIILILPAGQVQADTATKIDEDQIRDDWVNNNYFVKQKRPLILERYDIRETPGYWEYDGKRTYSRYGYNEYDSSAAKVIKRLNPDGTYAKGWQLIANFMPTDVRLGGGAAYWYYFDDNGVLLRDTTTPDGYTVDKFGRWTAKRKNYTDQDEPVPVGYLQSSDVGLDLNQRIGKLEEIDRWRLLNKLLTYLIGYTGLRLPEPYKLGTTNVADGKQIFFEEYGPTFRYSWERYRREGHNGFDILCYNDNLDLWEARNVSIVGQPRFENWKHEAESFYREIYFDAYVYFKDLDEMKAFAEFLAGKNPLAQVIDWQ